MEYKCGVKSDGHSRWGWLNVSGIKGRLDEVAQFIDEHNFSFTILEETCRKQEDILRHP